MIALVLVLAAQALASPLRPPTAETAPRNFVFAWLPSVTVGLAPVPSVSPGTFFFGGRVRPSWALGYQLALSFGGAERYSDGLVTHRHHLTGLHGFGRARRGLVGVGGGVALMLPLRPQVEVEGRVGVRIGRERRWVVGGLVRLGWNVFHRERVPMPQLGLFIGYAPL